MERVLSRLDRRWVFRELVGPGVLLALYCTVLMVVLPSGINRRFLMVLALIACAGVLGAIVLNALLARSGTLNDGASRSDAAYPPRRSDAVLLLLPLAPVVQYMLVNQDAMTPLGAVVGTTTLASVAAVMTLVTPYLARRVMSRTVAMMVGLALSFVLFNMAAFARSNRWHGLEDAMLPLAVLVVLIVGGVGLYRYRREGALVIAAAYFASTIVLVPLNSESSAVAVSDERLLATDSDARAAALASIAASDDEDLPDIIMLTFDAYVENETMLGYGIDNSEQEDFLESRGFEIERGTYSVAPDSMNSMGRVLGGITPAEGTAGISPMLEALESAGYETNGVFTSDYYFARLDPGYDRSFPDAWPGFMTMLRGILEGRFRHDLAFTKTPYDEFVEEKRTILTADTAAPQFLYAHGGPSHSQNSGVCLDDETELFDERLQAANQEMREDIDLVLEHRPNAVIVINGDHGPYLTKNCWGLQHADYDEDDVTRLDIQDRFGSFVAVRWPDGLEPEESDIRVLQDVMPTVLGQVFPDIDPMALRGSTRLIEDQTRVIAGLSVEDGTIIGGQLDGEPLYEGTSE